MSEVWFSVLIVKSAVSIQKQKLFTILEMLFRTAENTKD